MKKLFFLSLTVSCFLLNGSLLHAQDTNVANHSLTLGLNEVALLHASAGVVNLQLGNDISAGEAVASEVSDNSSFLQFSSVITSATRKLTAKYTGTLPAGTVLKAQALAPGVNAVGTTGTLIASDVTLSTVTDADLVTGIGSCYSGTLATDGYNLKYTWGLNDPASNYADVRATANAAITVVLTISPAQ